MQMSMLQSDVRFCADSATFVAFCLDSFLSSSIQKLLYRIAGLDVLIDHLHISHYLVAAVMTRAPCKLSTCRTERHESQH